MKTLFDQRELNIISELRILLSKVMGVTVVDDHVTVRFIDLMRSVTIKIESISSIGNYYDFCYLCECNYQKDITTNGNTILEKDILLCPDCYSPK